MVRLETALYEPTHARDVSCVEPHVHSSIHSTFIIESTNGAGLMVKVAIFVPQYVILKIKSSLESISPDDRTINIHSTFTQFPLRYPQGTVVVARTLYEVVLE